MQFLLDALTRNWSLKLTALVLAVLLWTVVKSEELTRVSVGNVPIEVVLRDPGWILSAPPSPETATVIFAGPWRELVRLAVQKPRIIIPVDEVRDSVEVRQLRTGWVQLDGGELSRLRTEDIRPGAVLLTFERLTTRVVPIAVRTRGELPPGLELAAPIRSEPAAIRVSGPSRRLEGVDSVPTEPIELGAVRGSAAIRARVDTAGFGGLLFSPPDVDVVVRVTPYVADSVSVGADGGSEP